MVKIKEFKKKSSFISFINSFFDIGKYDVIYDLCCGKGMVADYFLRQGYSAIPIDKKANNRAIVNVQEQDIFKLRMLQPSSLVLAMHACGTLTDRVIELSIESENDFAVVSCCHSDKIYFYRSR